MPELFHSKDVDGYCRFSVRPIEFKSIFEDNGFD
jgi:hypothetical protein